MSSLVKVASVCFATLVPMLAQMPGNAAAQATGTASSQLTVRSSEETIATAPVFVETLTRDGIAVLRDPNLDRTAQENYFRSVFIHSFALQEIGRRVLARAWSRTTPRQRVLFLDALGKRLADTLIRGFPTDGEFEVLSVREIETSQPETMAIEVKTHFNSVDFEGEVLWSLLAINGDIKILDATFAGRSFLGAQKTDFQEMLREVDGSIPALIEILRQ